MAISLRSSPNVNESPTLEGEEMKNTQMKQMKVFSARRGWLLSVAFMVAGLMLAPAPANAARACADSVTLTFRDADGDSVKSDGGLEGDGSGDKSYYDGANFECDGDLYFSIGNGRTLTFDLSAWGKGVVNAGGNVIFEVDSNSDSVRGVQASEETSKVQFNFVVDGTRYFLTFRPGTYSDTDNIDVRKVNDTWEIEASSTDRARLRSCKSTGKCTTTELQVVGDDGEPLVPAVYSHPAPFLITAKIQP
jgi:hypothetical protein